MAISDPPINSDPPTPPDSPRSYNIDDVFNAAEQQPQQSIDSDDVFIGLDALLGDLNGEEKVEDANLNQQPQPVANSRRAERLKAKYSVADIFFNAQREERVRCLVCLMFGQRNSIYTSDGGSGNFSLSDFKKHVEEYISYRILCFLAAIELLKNSQVMAILVPQRSVQADFVIDIGDKVRVPVISPSTSPALSSKESHYFIRSAWCSSFQAKAIAAIVKAFGWKEVTLVYEDSNYGSGLVPVLAQEMLNSKVLLSKVSAVSP